MVNDADAGNWALSGHDFAKMWPEVLGPVPTNPPSKMFLQIVEFMMPHIDYLFRDPMENHKHHHPHHHGHEQWW